MCLNCPQANRGIFLPDCLRVKSASPGPNGQSQASPRNKLANAQAASNSLKAQLDTGVDFTRVAIMRTAASLAIREDEEKGACKKIASAMKIRKKYMKQSYESYGDNPISGPCTFRMNTMGVYEVYSGDDDGNLFPVWTLPDFVQDYQTLVGICHDGSVKTISWERMKTLEVTFDIHKHLNAGLEDKASELGDKADFYSIPKVDTHVHLAAAFSPQDFVEYIKTKVREDSPEKVYRGKTLGQVMTEIGLTADNITLDVVDVQADNTLFDRFDRFNAKYNPAGNSSLREIFLKSENDIKGRYFAELTKIALKHLTDSKTLFAEYRMSVYGSSMQDWDAVAEWCVDQDLCDHPQNRWMVQMPRIYRFHKKAGKVECFADVLKNFFEPLFKVTNDPASNPKLAKLLENISGFDSVDDESLPDKPLDYTPATAWNSGENPGYAYQLYYFWANVEVLNQFRGSKGMNTFDLRPHCGESGDVMHLASAYMLSNGISHGINLDKNSVLEYLYYLDQVGVAVSPTSNNFLFLKIAKSPFDKFFRRGLNVSLSTDDPMLFHLSQHPLLEEFSIVRQFFSYSITDLSEIARNSARQCGFPHEWKLKWLGPDYKIGGAQSNNPDISNVPMIRAYFRDEQLKQEKQYLDRLVKGKLFMLKGNHQSSFDMMGKFERILDDNDSTKIAMEELRAENEALKKELAAFKGK